MTQTDELITTTSEQYRGLGERLLENEDLWPRFLKRNLLGGAQLIRWGELHRVYRLRDQVFKIQWKDRSRPAEQEVSHEYEILRILEGLTWCINSDFRVLEDGGKMLKMDWIHSECLEERLKHGHLGIKNSLLLLYTLFRVSLNGIVYKQFRARHIFIQKDGYPIFIDFGGSTLTSPWIALWKNFRMFTLVGRRPVFSSIFSILTVNIRRWLKQFQKEKLMSDSDWKLQRALFRWNMNASFYREWRDNMACPDDSLSNEDKEFLERAEDLTVQAVKQDQTIALDLYTIQIYPYLLYGSRDWGLLWSTLLEHIDFRNKTLVELGCGLGLIGSYASIWGARHVTALDSSVLMLEAAKIFSRAFGVKNSNFMKEGNDIFSKNRLSGNILTALSSRVNIYDNAFKTCLSGFNELILQIKENESVTYNMLADEGFNHIDTMLTNFHGYRIIHARRDVLTEL
jgi:hypothetical protein